MPKKEIKVPVFADLSHKNRMQGEATLILGKSCNEKT
jgi:hypothetical protein